MVWIAIRFSLPIYGLELTSPPPPPTFIFYFLFFIFKCSNFYRIRSKTDCSLPPEGSASCQFISFSVPTLCLFLYFIFLFIWLILGHSYFKSIVSLSLSLPPPNILGVFREQTESSRFNLLVRGCVRAHSWPRRVALGVIKCAFSRPLRANCRSS